MLGESKSGSICLIFTRREELVGNANAKVKLKVKVKIVWFVPILSS